MKVTIKASCVAVCMLGLSTSARADDLFSISANTNSGSSVSATASGSNVPDLVSDLVNSDSDFTGLENRGFDASLRYGGVDNAILVSRNANSTSATLSIPSTGYSKTFTANNQDDLENQIRDFLLKDGQKEYAKFLRNINEQSTLGVVDGNPQAGTALLANNAFNNFGLGRGLMLPMESGMPDDGGGTKYEVAAAFDSTDEGDGWHGTVSASHVLRLGNRVGIAFGPTFTYRDVEGASIYHLGSHIGVPIIIIGPRPEGFVWQVTPAFQAGVSGSEDLAAGGTIMGGSITSSIRVPIGSRFAVTVGNQYSFYEGYDLSFFGYDWHTDASQQIVKNGVRASFEIVHGLVLDAGITHTAFLQDAAVDSYLTPSVGLGLYFSAKQTSGVRVAYNGDIGDNFDSHGGSAQLFFNY